MSEPKQYELHDIELAPGVVASHLTVTVYPPFEEVRPVVRLVDVADSPSAASEAMRYFECAVGHRWLEPYAQRSAYAAVRECIVTGDCQQLVTVRRIVSASYS